MNQKEFLIDQIGLEILNLMKLNAWILNADFARDLNMAPSAILERLKKLEHKNVILQYKTRLNPSALQHTLIAYFFIQVNNGIRCKDTATSLASIPQVRDVHHAAEDDFNLIKIPIGEPVSLMDLTRNPIGKIPNIQTTRSSAFKEQQPSVIPRK